MQKHGVCVCIYICGGCLKRNTLITITRELNCQNQKPVTAFQHLKKLTETSDTTQSKLIDHKQMDTYLYKEISTRMDTCVYN